jgi:hypothetical protein
MRQLESELAPIRDTYVGGRAQDEEALEIHERQLEAMRSRDLRALASILDRHYRMLEESFARALHRDWDDLFGEVSEQTLSLAQQPPA